MKEEDSWMVFVTDLDGVLANSTPIIRTAILERYGYDIEEGYRNGWDIVIPGVPDHEIIETIRYALAAEWMSISPFPETLDSLQRIYRRIMSPFIILTAREESISRETYHWLWQTFRKGPPFRQYHVDNPKKPEFLCWEFANVYVDDRRETANDVALMKIPSIKQVFLVDRPWNIGETSTGVQRVPSLKEVADWIEEN